MHSKNIIFVIILGVGVLVAALFWPNKGNIVLVNNFEECKNAGYPITESYPQQCKTPDGHIYISPDSSKPETPATPTAEDMIVVDNVKDNQLINSPLVVTGKARGGWYFEASFPLELQDGDGNVLASSYATAQGDWMTNDYVPFKSQPLVYKTPLTSVGVLILHNDNASGLKENDLEVRIPVRFNTNTRAVKLYYYSSKDDIDVLNNILCSSKGTVAVNREIPTSLSPIKDTMKLLIAGNLTAEERNKGITTEFPLSGLELKNVVLSNTGTLTLTFDDPKHTSSGGACRVNILRAQIEKTALQFPEVKKVIISPNTVFQP